jgi:hypothetical protein
MQIVSTVWDTSGRDSRQLRAKGTKAGPGTQLVVSNSPIGQSSYVRPSAARRRPPTTGHTRAAASPIQRAERRGTPQLEDAPVCGADGQHLPLQIAARPATQSPDALGRFSAWHAQVCCCFRRAVAPNMCTLNGVACSSDMADGKLKQPRRRSCTSDTCQLLSSRCPVACRSV